jgi:hypothetical protein
MPATEFGGDDFHGGYRMTASVDPPSIGVQTCAEVAVTLPGVLATDEVVAVPPASLEAGLCLSGCRVSAADTVQLRLCNVTAGAIDGAARSWTFLGFRR